MSFLIDCLLIAVFLLTVVFGFKKGFILNIYDTISFVFVIAVACVLTQPVSDYLITTPLYEQIMDSVNDNFTENINSTQNNTSQDQKDASDKEILSNLQKFGVDVDSLFEKFNVSAKEGKDSTSRLAYNTIIEPVSKTIVKIISFIGLILIAMLASFLIRLVLSFVSKLPVLKGANKLLGGILGIVLGFLYVYLLSNLISFIVPGLVLLGVDLPKDVLENTHILKMFSGVDIISLINH